jgi:hypothetical protein
LKINFVLNYPWWFILLCIAAGLIFAGILYYKNRSDDFSNSKRWLLATFRFLIVTILSFLLLSPLLQMQVINKQEPVVLIFQDNSQSLVTTNAPGSITNTYSTELNNLKNILAETYSLASYSFGEKIMPQDTFDFEDKITDMSEIFESLDVLYSNRNVGAVIIAGDGIFNRGQNPGFMASKHLFPIYTIALGDTIPQKDLIINNIRHNRITYLNNIFPLEVTIEARQAEGSRSRIKIIHDEQLVLEKDVIITSDHYFETFTFNIEANETGIKRYRVEIEPIEEEISIENNIREFFIEVIDSRQKVLIIGAGPHPDIGAIRQSLDANENYETEVFLIQDFTKNILDYNMIIWHQLPSNNQKASSQIAIAMQANLPQLFVLGARSNINAFNQLQTGVQVNIRSAGFNDSRALPNNSFNLFQPNPESLELLSSFPPLQTPFAAYSTAPGTQIFAYQQIGNVSTEFPLIAFSQTTNRKTAVITGEGIWRWRMNNFARVNNHNAFNDIISRTIQFLAVVEDKSFFRVTTGNFIYENQQAIFEAELYNPSYELVNTPDVNLTITNEQGVSFDYIFGRTHNAYRLNAGIFPVGEYQYQASTSFGNDEFETSGLFTVSALNIEGINTVANHKLLFQLAENSGAKMYYPDQLNELAEELLQRTDLKPVLYTQYQYEDLINMEWIFFLILILLSVEWFIRKYSGSY